ncbi:MAG: endonuclease/exonuclease/phosphatase family protein, partial [Verrucomicrobiae bacterium]|nr:endonuclease/exonuclease/phosphatase family protein [Verrucomicrobiae bacterium]
GRTDDANDAFGYGLFPGQYGMVLLSRFPVDRAHVRTFRKLLWKDLPDAALPVRPDSGDSYYSDEILQRFRLSSKSHWDIPLQIGDTTLHILAAHPTPPAFDGPEDRNGRRNHDEIRLWAEYIKGHHQNWLRDDRGRVGGLKAESRFVICGDLNADPVDGDSFQNAARQLLEHDRVNAAFVPQSTGAAEAAVQQAGKNRSHTGPAAADTSDFNDRSVGNLRVDYVLPDASATVVSGGIFWPAPGEPLADAIDCSDHRLVWLDLQYNTSTSSLRPGDASEQSR